MSLQKEIHQVSLDHGWWEGADQKIIPEKLALIHSEVSEALEEYRNGNLEPCVYSTEGKPEGFGIELADIVIRLYDLAEWMGIDVDELVLLKHSYNKQREYRHGGKLA